MFDQRVYRLLILLMAMALLLGACAPPTAPVSASEPSRAPAQEPEEPPAQEPAEPPAQEPEEQEAPAVPAEPDIVEWLEADGGFGLLLEALKSAGLLDTLAVDGPFTLFAPTDQALERLPLATQDALFSDSDLLKEVLLFHVGSKPVQIKEFAMESADKVEVGLTAVQRVPTLQGRDVGVAVWEGAAKVENTQIIYPDNLASNGVVQVIDQVLTPVALPGLADQKPTDLDPEVEVWIPYLPGEPLPIGDAQWMPGAPVMREGVQALSSVLLELGQGNVQINTARTVVLGEQDELTYSAPPGPESVPKSFDELYNIALNQGFIMGTLAIEGQSTVPAGAYVQVVRVYAGDKEDVWETQLVDPDFEVVGSWELYVAPEDFSWAEVPAAAIYYGSKWCANYTSSGCYCHVCSFWEAIFETDWDTSAACQAAC